MDYHYTAQHKLRHLLIGMLITSALVVSGLALGANAIVQWLAGHTTQGVLGNFHSEVVYNTYDHKRSNHNTATASYSVEGAEYQIEVNTHLYKEFDLIQAGQRVTIAYPPSAPAQGKVMDGLLFDPLAPFLVAMGGLGLVLQLLQLPFLWRKARAEADAEQNG